MVRAALLALLLATPLSGQAWKKALTVAAVGTLWVDFSQISYGNRFGVPTTLFGVYLTTPVAATINYVEVLVNVYAPKRVRPWVNALTVVGHIPYLVKWSKRPIGLLQNAGGGETVLRVGWRLTP